LPSVFDLCLYLSLFSTFSGQSAILACRTRSKSSCSSLCSPTPARPLQARRTPHLAKTSKRTRRTSCGWFRVRISIRATDEDETMRVSRALNLGWHAPIHLSRLELREQLIQGQSIILLKLSMASNFPQLYDPASVRA
jgi:hypothetical protein